MRTAAPRSFGGTGLQRGRIALTNRDRLAKRGGRGCGPKSRSMSTRAGNVSPDPMKIRRCKLGGLFWLATVTRPDTCALLAQLASQVDALQGRDINRISDLLKTIKAWQGATTLKYMSDMHLGTSALAGWSDAAYGAKPERVGAARDILLLFFHLPFVDPAVFSCGHRSLRVKQRRAASVGSVRLQRDDGPRGTATGTSRPFRGKGARSSRFAGLREPVHSFQAQAHEYERVPGPPSFVHPNGRPDGWGRQMRFVSQVRRTRRIPLPKRRVIFFPCRRL